MSRKCVILAGWSTLKHPVWSYPQLTLTGSLHNVSQHHLALGEGAIWIGVISTLYRLQLLSTDAVYSWILVETIEILSQLKIIPGMSPTTFLPKSCIKNEGIPTTALLCIAKKNCFHNLAAYCIMTCIRNILKLQLNILNHLQPTSVNEGCDKKMAHHNNSRTHKTDEYSIMARVHQGAAYHVC